MELKNYRVGMFVRAADTGYLMKVTRLIRDQLPANEHLYDRFECVCVKNAAPVKKIYRWDQVEIIKY